MLFLCGAQQFLRSSVVIVLDLDVVDVTLKIAEIFGSVLSGAAEMLPVSRKTQI